MLEEYFIWKKIFETNDLLKIEKLVNLVIQDPDAKNLVSKEIISLKERNKEVYKLNVNIDKELVDYPIEELAKNIVEEIIKKGY